MKKQVFCLILCVCFMLAAIPSVWAIENGDFETGETGWTPYRTCPNTSPPGVSIQNNSAVFPALGDSTKVAVYYGIVGSCKETNAHLKKTITIPSDATALTFYYKIAQPFGTLGLAEATFRVKLMEQGTTNLVEELVPIYQQSLPNNDIEPIVYEWKQPDQEISVSAYAGQTYDFYFQFSTTDAKSSYAIYFMLDNISFVTGAPDPVPGDIYNEDGVNLTDAIISLQITAGINPANPINMANDVDANNVIGLENPIYILQDVAGLRTP